MRYKKETHSLVQNDIKQGLSPQQCAEKYQVPVSVVVTWANLNTTLQRAKEIAVRKYQAEVTEAEGSLTSLLADYFDERLSDKDYFDACKKVTDSLYALVSDVVKKERDLHPHEDPPSDAQIIIEITNRWKDNKFLKVYSI